MLLKQLEVWTLYLKQFKNYKDLLIKMKIKIILFDLDGTLYPLKNGSFLNSSIYKEMKTRTIDFLSSKISMNREEAKLTFEKILKNYNYQLSLGFEKEFNIPREEYFSYSWNIDPSKHIPNDGSTREVFSNLKDDFKLVIVSDAPLIWIEHVIEYFEIKEFISRIFSGESNIRKVFGNRFSLLINKLDILPENVMMVGDSENEDIVPAKKIGMKTVYIGKNKSSVADYSITNVN